MISMRCDDARILIHGDLDDELEAAEAVRLDQHLAGCEACRRVRDRQRALRAAVKKHAADRFPAPETLGARILAALPAEPVAPARRRFPWRWLEFGAALVGTAALACGLTYFLVVPGQDERFADEAVAGHSRSLLEDHLTDVRSSDPAMVRSWFRSRLDFAVSVKDLSDRGFALVGGRLDYLYDREVAAVVYRRGTAAINLFVWPAEATDAIPRNLSDEGFGIALWTEAGINHCAIGKLDARELAEFVEAYRAGAG